MIRHTLNGYEIAFPELPEGVPPDSLFIHQGALFSNVKYAGTFRMDLPPGDWQLFRLSEVGELLAGEMVDRWDSGAYTDYERHLARVSSAHASLASWVRSKGVEGDCYLLIKKNEP